MDTKREQLEMFEVDEVLPIFTGAPMKGHVETFAPGPAARQLTTGCPVCLGTGVVKVNGPTLVNRPGPKWIRILGSVLKSHVVTTPYRYRRKAAAYGHKPINLRNEVTPLRLSA